MGFFNDFNMFMIEFFFHFCKFDITIPFFSKMKPLQMESYLKMIDTLYQLQTKYTFR